MRMQLAFNHISIAPDEEVSGLLTAVSNAPPLRVCRMKGSMRGGMLRS
jgi:hypothetical protein